VSNILTNQINLFNPQPIMNKQSLIPKLKIDTHFIVEDGFPEKGEIIAKIWGKGLPAHNTIQRIVDAVNEHDELARLNLKMAKLLHKFHRYHTDDKWRREVEINAEEVTGGTISYLDAITHQAESLSKKILHQCAKH